MSNAIQPAQPSPPSATSLPLARNRSPVRHLLLPRDGRDANCVSPNWENSLSNAKAPIQDFFHAGGGAIKTRPTAWLSLRHRSLLSKLRTRDVCPQYPDGSQAKAGCVQRARAPAAPCVQLRGELRGATGATVHRIPPDGLALSSCRASDANLWRMTSASERIAAMLACTTQPSCTLATLDAQATAAARCFTATSWRSSDDEAWTRGPGVSGAAHGNRQLRTRMTGYGDSEKTPCTPITVRARHPLLAQEGDRRTSISRATVSPKKWTRFDGGDERRDDLFARVGAHLVLQRLKNGSVARGRTMVRRFEPCRIHEG